MMMAQILKCVDFTKTKKSRFLQNDGGVMRFFKNSCTGGMGNFLLEMVEMGKARIGEWGGFIIG